MLVIFMITFTIRLLSGSDQFNRSLITSHAKEKGELFGNPVIPGD